MTLKQLAILIILFPIGFFLYIKGIYLLSGLFFEEETNQIGASMLVIALSAVGGFSFFVSKV